MRRPVTALTVFILAGALAACSEAPESAPAPTVTVTETVTATPEPEPSETPVADEPEAPVPVGQSQDGPEGWVMTVHAVDADPAPSAPAPESAGTKWFAADVEACSPAGFGDATVSTSPWRLVDSENRQWEASSVGYQQFPEPAYAWGSVPIAGGECVRGWIVFTVGQDAQLVSVKYQADGYDAILWTIG